MHAGFRTPAFGPARYQGYDEAMILYVLALGSPTFPADCTAWQAFTSTYKWGAFYGQEHLNVAPLFGHQYSHVWIDFRGIHDAYMRERGIDYFENSRRATLAQRASAMDNPNRWRDYSGGIWGLTTSDGPKDTTMIIDGVSRRFHTYWARGAGLGDIRDHGTIAPTAAGGSIPFAPEITIAALGAQRMRYDDNQLGIDQGPIITMIANYRNGFVCERMKSSPYIVRGLCRAGFNGGWLDGKC